MKSKQKGFGLLETILAMMVFSLFATMVLKGVNKFRDVENARNYTRYVERVITQLQQYQYYQVTSKHLDPATAQVWPLTLEKLMSVDGQFWPQCSIASERDRMCQRPDSVPWTNQKIGYKILPSNLGSVTTAELTIPLSVIPSNQRTLWHSQLRDLPFAVTQANGDIKVLIKDPLLSAIYKDYLRKDGSTKLTNTWDVGKQSIENAKSVSIVGNNGMKNTLGVRYVGTAKSGTRINKVDFCPAGAKPDLIAIPVLVGSTSKLNNIRDIANWYIQKDDRDSRWWTVNILMNISDGNDNNEWKKVNDGYFQWEAICVPK